MRKITSLFVVLVALISFNVFAGSGIFVRGGLNNWGSPADWEFVAEGNNVYTLTNKELKGAFKIADAKWSDACNYGSNGAKIVPGETYNLVSKGGNIEIDGVVKCNKITLTLNGADATLFIEGSGGSGGEILKMYIIGDNNAWNFNDNSATLSKVEGKDKMYEGEVTFPELTTFAFWRIYEDLGQVGSWGTESGENLDAHTLTGTLKRGSEGCVTTTSGTYKASFNLGTGEFVLTSTGGVNSIDAESVKVIGGNGVITINGNVKNVEVYSMTGSLISKNATTVEMPAGVYIVVIDNKAVKVRVK